MRVGVFLLSSLMSWRHWRKQFKFNRVIWILIYSDLLIVTGTGFLAPILAVYVTGQIRGGSLAVVGFSTTAFWIVKSLLQLPISWYLDKRDNDVVTYRFMISGAVITSIVPLLYFFLASRAWHVFLFESLNGVGFALQVPAWFLLFGKHLDQHKEASEWAAHSNAIGIGYAVSAAIGGVLAERYGFGVIFLLVSGVMVLGAFALVAARRELVIIEHRKALSRPIDAAQAADPRDLLPR